MRLSTHLNMSMIHRGGRTNAKANESSKLRLHNKESVASFDPTRTQANPDITYDLAAARSSPSITTIEEVPDFGKQMKATEKRGVSFEPFVPTIKDRKFQSKHPSEIGKLIEDLPVQRVLELDDDDAVQLGDVQRMETNDSDSDDVTVHEQQKDLYSKIQRKIQVKCKPALERMQNLNNYETMRSSTIVVNPLR